MRILVVLLVILEWCSAVDFQATHSKHNRAAYVTSQCYTKTKDDAGRVHNPCYSCHTTPTPPNFIDDSTLPTTYAMGGYTQTNRFTNLFKDRTKAVAQISDAQILGYIRVDNYKKGDELALATRLAPPPKEWDVNKNGVWEGYQPDCYFHFDREGFDIDPSGGETGWRAFGYYPFLGTFWPTNGSMDDILIRLPLAFRQDSDGKVSKEIYKINLAIIESLIKEKNITLENPADERLYGVDLDQNGVLSFAHSVVFAWKKPSFVEGKIGGFTMSYVGVAKHLLESNELLIAPGLYPKGTEFLHTVRYIDIDETNTSVRLSARMKELRYAKKLSWNTYAQLKNAAMSEIKEKSLFPDRLRTITGDSEQGLQTGLGWVYQGFIEDEKGDLRPQNYEETQYCIGCHSGIGVIRDSTFAFGRKFDITHFQKGWYHWSQKNGGLKGILEPKNEDSKGEYTLYLQKNGAGDEFRSNEEVKGKFFDTNGTLRVNEAQKIQTDISHLLHPSTTRALELNKSYRVIVEEQSYIYGRDPHTKPLESVYDKVIPNASTGIVEVGE